MAYDRLGGRKTLKVSGFLDEFEKDEVKKRVDIVSLFESFGVKLKHRGRNYTGLCPWHDDKNPSLSVDRGKGLYNCFGCGESGDAVTLVEKMKNLSFREALEYLKHYSGEIKNSSSTAAPVRMKKAGTPDYASHPEAHNLPLNSVAQYYHKRLYGNKKAEAYLEKRGLYQGQLIKRFCMGFADGSLLKLLSNGQKEELKALGILHDNGSEHLYNCITVPLHDETGNTVGLYGRSIEASPTLPHLYLKGKHRGIFNRKVSRVYDQIILSESILDALSLITLGFENVQALYGTGGFTEEHLNSLKADRVKTVVLALDSDEAGKKASRALQSKLLKEIFSVKVVFPQSAKDWNDYLLQNPEPEKLKTMIEQAQTFNPQKETDDQELEVIRDGPRYVFQIGKLSYRILGVRELFVSSLRVNVKVEYNSEFFYDNLDLYSSRSRAAYSLSLSRLFGAEQVRIEKDLILILEYLEKERDKKLIELSSGPQAKELTEEQQKLGMGFLKSPDLLDQIVQDLEVLGYVGESLNKQLVYLAASSRKLDDPISILILSQSASGKSMLIDMVRKLMPEEEVVAVTSLSDQALNYIPEGGLTHKLLILGEAVHSEVVEHQIREMLSAHELSRMVTVKDEKTGRLSTQQIKTRVVVSAMVSSTDYGVNQENISRSFVIGSDESRLQTQRIHRSQRKKYSFDRLWDQKHRIPQIIEKHRAAQRLLNKVLILNPFAEYLDFPDTLMRTRRDHERFVDLIACVCFLRQYQKEVKMHQDPVTGEGFEFIECDEEDYRVAYRIMVGSVLSSLTELSASDRELYESLRKMAKELGKKNGLKVGEVSFSQRDIREHTGYGQSWIKQHLRRLTEYEYVLRLKGGRRGERCAYSLQADEKLASFNFSMIPDPEKIKSLREKG